MAFAIRLILPGTMEIQNSKIKALIIDMDGVLWKDKEPIVDIDLTFSRIREKGYQFIFATNNSSRTPTQYQEKIRSLGGEVKLDQIVTSSMVAAHLVKQKIPQGGAVYLIGETGLFEAFQNEGFHHSEENVQAVVAGLDRQFTFEKLKKANHFIRKGALFVGTNPDKTFPTPHEIAPGAGSIIVAIEAASEQTAIIAGKPEPTILEFAMTRMNVTPEQTLVIGDRLETDILGGQNAGCKTALVLSGISSAADGEKWSPKPDLVSETLQTLFM
jgi:4-nitrophenyl phosphatase